jgi:hypothetical protein
MYEDYRELEDLSREARYEFSIITQADLSNAVDLREAIKATIGPIIES